MITSLKQTSPAFLPQRKVSEAQADAWARERWSNAVDDWRTYRRERLFYREKVLRPCLQRIVEDWNLHPDYQWVDLGCGDCEESSFFARLLRSKGASSLHWLGVDREVQLLKDAQALAKGVGGQ